MSNVRLTWTNSTPSQRQRPIAHVRIEARVAGIDEWTVLNTVALPDTELLIEAVDPGTWEYRGIEVDDAGVESVPVSTSVDVPFDAPSGLETFEATLE